jgi:NAD(P)-dependent dehydrogenase (short-subunit alcohol dehydrogenase family)
VSAMKRMDGRRAIITGATSGMGRATALLFAREGAAIVASGRDAARGRALEEEIRGGAATSSSCPAT